LFDVVVFGVGAGIRLGGDAAAAAAVVNLALLLVAVAQRSGEDAAGTALAKEEGLVIGVIGRLHAFGVVVVAASREEAGVGVDIVGVEGIVEVGASGLRERADRLVLLLLGHVGRLDMGRWNCWNRRGRRGGRRQRRHHGRSTDAVVVAHGGHGESLGAHQSSHVVETAVAGAIAVAGGGRRTGCGKGGSEVRVKIELRKGRRAGCCCFLRTVAAARRLARVHLSGSARRRSLRRRNWRKQVRIAVVVVDAAAGRRRSTKTTARDLDLGSSGRTVAAAILDDDDVVDVVLGWFGGGHHSFVRILVSSIGIGNFGSIRSTLGPFGGRGVVDDNRPRGGAEDPVGHVELLRQGGGRRFARVGHQKAHRVSGHRHDLEKDKRNGAEGSRRRDCPTNALGEDVTENGRLPHGTTTHRSASAWTTPLMRNATTA
jgi:hypothetical protein